MSIHENNAWDTTTLEYDNYANNNDDNNDDNESDYSLDYEFPGPRYANHRTTVDNDNDIASDLSDSEVDLDAPRFDMWDDDPYTDFTWESNDMQLSKFMKRKQKQLGSGTSFWRKEKGWPRQLPYSCSSTNHDQSANAICLVQSNYGLSEQLYSIYRDGIIQCGKSPNMEPKNLNKLTKQEEKRDTTYIDNTFHNNHHNNSNSSDPDKFIDTHQSISLSKLYTSQSPILVKEKQDEYIKRFKPYTKYIKRSDFPGLLSEDDYLPLGFDSQCLAQKYGYLAIGGIEGEFELYCCMEPTKKPIKIWGTKFKGKNDVLLMTNAIQLVRFKRNDGGGGGGGSGGSGGVSGGNCSSIDYYQHMLIVCMNEAGVLFYNLPSHNQCDNQDFRTQEIVKLHSHLRSFNGVPINDAKLSPDGTKLVCVGDVNIIFMIDVYHCNNITSFSNPMEIVIPNQLLLNQPYLSQYVTWSSSSLYFAHTSDSHNLVIIWKTSTREILYTIDTAGYTYAISFHPKLDNILVFTNRYGYFHTVDLSANQQIQHEITMISFRGEINKSLRILAKINGIEWSKDGKYLYVATKKRVLAFQFLLTHGPPTLLDITGIHIRRLLEEGTTNSPLSDWSFLLPDNVQSRIIGDTKQLACHW